MPASHATRATLRLVTPSESPHGLQRLRSLLEIPETPSAMIAALPFVSEDATAGMENEWQAAVQGASDAVDLPLSIKNASYYGNLVKKAAAGDTARSKVTELESFLTSNTDGIWENSWVRLPLSSLTAGAMEVFEKDLMADKRDPGAGRRTDADRFYCRLNGEAALRIPISYLLKLALADVVTTAGVPPLIADTGLGLLEHFLSDNTSPEVTSFAPVVLSTESGMGTALVHEASRRTVLSQLLLQYANRKFGLNASGQHAILYASPQPPLRQKRLNDLVSDAFYRELFMSPCLSGWDCGETKHRYMALCHQVLSRSQLNAVGKLKEAGIITNNLVVLPNTSSTCLSNNGVHISLGSRKLGRLLAGGSGFGPQEEKYLGDLTLKIMEHFLPLMVGTYSAAPYRLDFEDFHPEKALGFLPHELEFTHLRMLWRRWKKKADLNCFGRPLTPFGPLWLDQIIARGFRLRGDLVTDFRIIDYLVAVLGTEENPSMDGTLGNDRRLKQDLAASGVFDPAMPLYLPVRNRPFADYGYSGFEARYYSQFFEPGADLRHAVNLQALVAALAYRYALSGACTHLTIPDSPFIESERRQVLFGAAIGIPTFYVRKDTRNHFIRRVVEKTSGTRQSRRYAGYIRVLQSEYKRALLDVLRTDGADLIEAMGLDGTISDLSRRLSSEGDWASSRLVDGILETAGAKNAMAMPAAVFNAAAETYYRQDLKRRHLAQALKDVCADADALDDWQTWREGYFNQSLLELLDGRSARQTVEMHQAAILDETVPPAHLTTLIQLILLCIHKDARDSLERGKS
ncbi:MAG: hypothetical protein ABIL58_24955 [Pseudomonadota bacterium]